MEWNHLSAKTKTQFYNKGVESPNPGKRKSPRIPNIYLIKKSQLKKEKTWETTTQAMFRPNILPKKTVQQKGNHHFLGLALRRKNYGFQRKMSSKKELILFSGQTLCKKKYGIQETVWVPKKKGTHTFFRPNIV